MKFHLAREFWETVGHHLRVILSKEVREMEYLAMLKAGRWLGLTLTPSHLHHGLCAGRESSRGQRELSKSQALAAGSLLIRTEMSHAKGIRVGQHQYLLHTTSIWHRVDAKVCLLSY